MKQYKSSDTLSIKQWAEDTANEHRNSIQFYIREGITKDKALKMVLKDSCLGAGYKAQIEYEFKFAK